jgi:hypothetical protein
VAWNRFSVWAIHYWLSLNPWLVEARRRQRDETLWPEYGLLQQVLIQTDAKQRNRTEDQVREEYQAARSDFLKRESLLRTSSLGASVDRAEYGEAIAGDDFTPLQRTGPYAAASADWLFLRRWLAPSVS